MCTQLLFRVLEQQQQNFINEKNNIAEVLPTASKAIRGGKMHAKYKNKD